MRGAFICATRDADCRGSPFKRPDEGIEARQNASSRRAKNRLKATYKRRAKAKKANRHNGHANGARKTGGGAAPRLVQIALMESLMTNWKNTHPSKTNSAEATAATPASTASICHGNSISTSLFRLIPLLAP